MTKIIYLIRDPETNTFYNPWNPEYVEPTKDIKRALRFDSYALAHRAILEAEFPIDIFLRIEKYYITEFTND